MRYQRALKKIAAGARNPRKIAEEALRSRKAKPKLKRNPKVDGKEVARLVLDEGMSLKKVAELKGVTKGHIGRLVYHHGWGSLKELLLTPGIGIARAVKIYQERKS